MRYIDADRIPYITSIKGLEYAQKTDIDLMPTADVEEVRHGEWEFNMLDNYKKYSVTCPFCSAEYTDNYDGYINVDDFNYCPNCGARMDGGENDQTN